eukprot:188009-Amphidinium_carterae.1
MQLALLGGPNACLEFCVLDFSDAYWQVPISPGEQKFFTVCVLGRYYVILRVPQGSGGGPLVWSRVAALTMRMTQA